MQTKSLNRYEQLCELEAGQVTANALLSNYCTWKIGGPADVLVEPTGAQELSKVLSFASENGLRYIIIGDGSNVLFSDEGFRGIVIRMGRAMSDVCVDGNKVYAQAGVAVPRLARMVGLAGLSGLEHTSGIPGTLGGLAAMNGGSLRQNIGQVIERVRCLDESGQILELSGADCGFSYRRSIFLEKPWIVTDVVLKLQAGHPKEIYHRMLDILRERRQKYPRRIPNCGSVFKSDTALHERCGPPGWIVEQAGLKGLSIGGAQVSAMHANFILNTGSATAADVLELIGAVRNRVHETHKVWLECEVRYICPDGQIMPAHLAV